MSPPRRIGNSVLLKYNLHIAQLILSYHRKQRDQTGSRSDGLGEVPDKLLVDIPRAVGEELLNAEVAVVEEDGVGDLRGAIHLAVKDAAAEAVKGHRDDLRPLRPTDRPVLGVVHPLKLRASSLL